MKCVVIHVSFNELYEADYDYYKNKKELIMRMQM